MVLQNTIRCALLDALYRLLLAQVPGHHDQWQIQVFTAQNFKRLHPAPLGQVVIGKDEIISGGVNPRRELFDGLDRVAGNVEPILS